MFCPYSCKCPEGIKQSYPLYAEDNHYIVQAGDTLYAISRFYNISLDDMIEANPCIEPENITPGQIISIPLAVSQISCPTGATAYIIQKGDTFYSIARRFKMHLSPLLKANPGINPDALLVGQTIYIPTISSIYTNAAYRIRLVYPYRWSKIDNERYEGIDGFFQISAISCNESLEMVSTSEAHHRHKPYGTQPVISKALTVSSESFMIIPSEDQPMEMRGQSALIVKYDSPVEIKDTSYEYLMIWADNNHIKDIAATLEFLPANNYVSI